MFGDELFSLVVILRLWFGMVPFVLSRPSSFTIYSISRHGLKIGRKAKEIELHLIARRWFKGQCDTNKQAATHVKRPARDSACSGSPRAALGHPIPDPPGRINVSSKYVRTTCFVLSYRHRVF